MGILNMRGLVKQVRGVSYKPSDIHDSLDDDSITLLRANNINDGQINFDDVVFVDRKNVSKEQILRKGDVLICASSGSKNLVGKAASVCFEREATFGAFCKVVRPNCQEDAGYIGMYFQSESYKREISSVAIGANINNIRNEHIDSLCLNWPNTIERQQAVQVMTKVDSIIRLRKSELNQLDDLIKARFVEMFGNDDYPSIPLIETIMPGAGLSYGIIVPGNDVDGGIPMVRPSDFKNGALDLSNVYRVGKEIESKYSRTRLVGDEILVQVIGQPGQVMLATSECKGMNVTRNLAVIRPNHEKINRIYLKCFIEKDDSQHFLLKNTKQSTLKQLPLNLLKQLEVQLPPMVMQNRFADFVKQVDKSKLIVQKSLDETQTLFDSLMQEYFG